MKTYKITEKLPNGYFNLILTTKNKKEALVELKTKKILYKNKKFYLTVVNE